jgi:hypothetical protein
MDILADDPPGEKHGQSSQGLDEFLHCYNELYPENMK